MIEVKLHPLLRLAELLTEGAHLSLEEIDKVNDHLESAQEKIAELNGVGHSIKSAIKVAKGSDKSQNNGKGVVIPADELSTLRDSIPDASWENFQASS